MKLNCVKKCNNETRANAMGEDIIMPLSIQLPQVDGCIKYFESGAKKMSFLIKKDDKVLYTIYSKIWKKN